MAHRIWLAAMAVAVPLVVAGCTSDHEAHPSPSGSSRVVQLGAPGEPNRELGQDEVDDLAGARTEPGEADIAFARDMVPHHEQALQMTRLTLTNGASSDVRLLAERMQTSQQDEVAQLQRWLAEQGPLPPDDHSRHGGDAHAGMPGMLTDAELAALTAARGEAFDELFLTSMIRHHEGATAMVADLFASPDGGQDVFIGQFARDIDGDQRIEIARMSSMLAEG